MFDIAAALGDLSTEVKLGWTVWFAWGVVMLGWYRHARVVAPMAPVVATAQPVRFTTNSNEVTTDLNDGPAYAEPHEYSETTE